MTTAVGRPTVVHVTTVAMSLELLLGPQLEAFVDAGYRVIGASAADEYVPAVEARGVEHVPLRHATRAWSPTSDLRLVRELHGLFRRIRPDIVHTHNPKPGVLGRFAAGAARVPVVVNTVHGLYALPDDRLAKRGVVYGLERLASFASDAELVQNPEDIPVLRRLGIPADKITLLGNGVDLDRFGPDPEGREAVRTELGFGADEVVFGVVGRLVAEKGFVELFEVVDRLAGSHPNLRWMVVGPDDPDKPDALDRGLVRRAEAEGVRFLGSRTDVERLYPAMDVFVLPVPSGGFLPLGYGGGGVRPADHHHRRARLSPGGARRRDGIAGTGEGSGPAPGRGHLPGQRRRPTSDDGKAPAGRWPRRSSTSAARSRSRWRPTSGSECGRSSGRSDAPELRRITRARRWCRSPRGRWPDARPPSTALPRALRPARRRPRHTR